MGPMEATGMPRRDRKSTRLNSSHLGISYAVFCLKKKKITRQRVTLPVPQNTAQHPQPLRPSLLTCEHGLGFEQRAEGRGYDRGMRIFFFNDTATTEIYTLSLHDALPI